MAAMSVLASRYLFARLGRQYPALPAAADGVPRMHEFILTLTEEDFRRIEAAGAERDNMILDVARAAPRFLAGARAGVGALEFRGHASATMLFNSVGAQRVSQ